MSRGLDKCRRSRKLLGAMSLLIAQLSDVHAKTATDPIVGRWDALCRAVEAELDSRIQACVLVFNGDAAYGGKADEFSVVADLLARLKRHVALARPRLPVHVVTVPGN